MNGDYDDIDVDDDDVGPTLQALHYRHCTDKTLEAVEAGPFVFMHFGKSSNQLRRRTLKRRRQLRHQCTACLSLMRLRNSPARLSNVYMKFYEYDFVGAARTPSIVLSIQAFFSFVLSSNLFLILLSSYSSSLSLSLSLLSCRSLLMVGDE